MGSEVTLMYRRGEADMPSRLDEVRHAKEEGIEFMCCTNPVRFIEGENKAVAGVEAEKTKRSQVLKRSEWNSAVRVTTADVPLR